MPHPLCILRHDVDRLPENALHTAKLENELGIKGTYYFRIVPASFNEKIIIQIAELGHEIGYHYEEVDLVWRQVNGKWSIHRGGQVFNGKLKNKSNETIKQSNNDTSHFDSAQYDTLSMTIDLAYEMFKENLEKIRSVADIKTICMHGSPLSPYDNRDIWKKYKYRELGIIGEPYFDINFNEFGYLSDTGRRWNGTDVSVRDKIDNINVQFSIINAQLKSTQDIIDNIDKLPDKLMITVHPERWNDNLFLWTKQLVMQNIKNVIKRFLVISNEG